MSIMDFNVYVKIDDWTIKKVIKSERIRLPGQADPLSKGILLLMSFIYNNH